MSSSVNVLLGKIVDRVTGSTVFGNRYNTYSTQHKNVSKYPHLQTGYDIYNMHSLDTLEISL